MAVGHEDIAVGSDRDAGRSVEQIRSRSTNARRAERHQHLALRADLEDGLPDRDALRVLRRHPEDRFVRVRIRRPDVAGSAPGESVRLPKETDTEALEKPPGGANLENRGVGVSAIQTRGVAGGLVVETTMEDPDVAVRRDVHPDDFTPLLAVRPFPPRGRRRPVAP